MLLVRTGRAGQVNYLYDELGRLVAVVDPSGETATYTYDAVGNILSIGRHSSAQVSVVGFTPSCGSTGTSVTIYGTGFSTTPSQNTVTFNGVGAAVSAAAATQLVVSAPAGVTAGPITVTTPAGSATSSASFSVGCGGPVITGFTPTIGTSGTPVTISGSNFESSPTDNVALFNGGLATVSSATATSIATTAPPGGTSGRISVRTPFGSAVSSGDFFIPPAPYTPADVAFTGRMGFGETRTVSVTSAGKVALMLFDGVQGQRASLALSNSTFPVNNHLSIYAPSGAALLSPTCIECLDNFTDALTLPATGTYTIMLDPDGTSTGSVTFALYDVPPDLTAPIAPGGPPVTLTVTAPGQNGRLTFSGTAGQRVSLKMSGSTLPGVNYVSIAQPDTTLLVPRTCIECTGGFVDVQTLPATGTYTILLDPYTTNTGSMTFTLYDVPPDVGGTIAPGGSPVTVTVTTPGQKARFTFGGTAGRRVSLAVSNSTFPNLDYVSILNPDGSALVGSTCIECVNNFIDVQTLPVTGTYTIVLDPPGPDTGRVTLTLYDVPPDVSGTIVPGGPSVTATVTTPGQNARLTFAGTAGHRMSLGMTNDTLPGINYLSILNPDGSALIWRWCIECNGLIDQQTLPATGTYTILLDPPGTNTGSLTLTLYDGPADLLATITPGGPAVTITINTPQQNARITFNGTAGRRVSLKMSNDTFPGSNYVSIYNPDGTTLVAPWCIECDSFIDPVTLPATGTYAILLDPAGTNTGSVTLTLYDVPPDVTGTITANGSAVTLTVTTPGQNGRLSFSGTAAHRVSLKMSNDTFPGSNYVSIYNPDGTTLVAPWCIECNSFIDPVTLPATGTYAILLDPAGTNTGSVTLTLYDVPPDVTGTITAGGSAVTLTVTTPGQNGRLTFSGTAGQRVSLKMSNKTLPLPNNFVSIKKPDGTPLVANWCIECNNFIEPQTLPTTGTYTILLDPTGPNTGSLTFNLYLVPGDVTGTIKLPGSATLTTTAPGQNGKLTFSGSSGKTATVKVTSSTMGCVAVTLLRPDSSTLTGSTSCSASFNLASQTLPTTGTYTIRIDPQGANTGKITINLTSP